MELKTIMTYCFNGLIYNYNYLCIFITNLCVSYQ